MKTMYVQPAPGAINRMPEDPARHLPSEGGEVPASKHWLRRLADGSILPATRPKGGK